LVGDTPRKDHTYGGGFGLTYVFNEYLTAKWLGNHTWTRTNSGPGYKRTTVELSLDLKL